MGTDRETTPEKQLLKLIEDSKGGAAKLERPKRGGLKFLSFGSLGGALRGRFSFFKRKSKEKAQRPKKFSFSLRIVNRALVLSVGLLLAYVVTDTVAQAMSLNKIPDFSPQQDLVSRPLKELTAPLKSAGYYQEKVSARDLFREGEIAEEAEEAAGPKVEAAGQLALVGIAWSANPDAIIEDKSIQKTYFVKKGQVFGSNVKVRAIYKNKVVLSSQGSEFELK